MSECSLVPSETIFVGCVENIHLPANIVARIALRNSRIRQGLQLEAPIYHPGHKTQVYFRVTNISKSVIELSLNDELASITFEKLESEPQKIYNGAFQQENNFKGMSEYSEDLSSRMKHISENIFVIMPYGEEWSDTLNAQIKKIGAALNMTINRADEVYGIKPVINDIVKSIQNAGVILSVMTGGNRNVNYELGLAHAWKKPSIMVTRSKEDIPIDYQHLRVIYYNENDLNWKKELIQNITETVNSIKREGLSEYNYFKL